MSWMSRLKQTKGTAPEVATTSQTKQRASDETRAASLPPATAVEPGAVSDDEILELLCSDLVALSEGKISRGEIDESGHLFDYGYVDSLSAVAFLARIEERFGVQIEDMELIDDVSDLRSIIGCIRSRH